MHILGQQEEDTREIYEKWAWRPAVCPPTDKSRTLVGPGNQARLDCCPEMQLR